MSLNEKDQAVADTDSPLSCAKDIVTEGAEVAVVEAMKMVGFCRTESLLVHSLTCLLRSKTSCVVHAAAVCPRSTSRPATPSLLTKS